MKKSLWQIYNKAFMLIFSNKKRTGQGILIFLILFLGSNTSFSSPIGEVKYQLKKIVIDAGHGGKDPGAIWRSVQEKDVVLNIALKLGHYIEQNFKEVEVIYTRKTDVFVPLDERADIANKNNADLFISIHANSMPDNRKVSGTETFLMGLHTDEKNFEVAKKENAVISLEEDYNVKYENFDPNSEESYIIFSLMKNKYLEQSLMFASLIQDQFKNRVKRIDRGVKQAGFIVLWRTSMPSVLIETGFITNSAEEKYLTSEQGQDYLASAIYRAFKEYKQKLENGVSYIQEEIAENQPITSDNMDSNQVTLKPEPENIPKENGTTEEPGLHFRVQISASRNPLPLNSSVFKNIQQVEEFRTPEYYKYTVGRYNTFSEAKDALLEIRIHFQDAFIIAIENNELIPLWKARNK